MEASDPTFCSADGAMPERRRRIDGAFPSENRCVDVEKAHFSL